MNHSTERTGTCEAPDAHDFKLEIIDLSLSQNESEIVQEPTPVEDSTHEIIDLSDFQNEYQVAQEPTLVSNHDSSEDRTSDSDAVKLKVMAPSFQWPKLSFQFTPILDSYIFWDGDHNFVIFQRFSDNRNNMSGKTRLRSYSWVSDVPMVFEVDGNKLPVDFPVHAWYNVLHCEASTSLGQGVDIFAWKQQKTGFRRTDYLHSDHSHLFVGSGDNFTIFQRDFTWDRQMVMCQFSFCVHEGSTLRFTRPAVGFQPARRVPMRV